MNLNEHSEVYNHNCIKPECTNQYQDTEPEAYYCASCNEERKKIAAKIDATVRPNRNIKSDLQLYEEQAVTYTGKDGRRISFMRG